jgi:mRNA interferase MazF
VTTPRRGEVWLATLDPTLGHEQGGSRPCVVVSADAYNRLPIGMVIVVPLTTRDRGFAHQPAIASETAGLPSRSFARPEDVRAISTARLGKRFGQVSDDELAAMAGVLRAWLDLDP